MAGYTRQSAASIQPSQNVTAAPVNAEFNAIETAFGTSGHTHDGTSGNGPKVSLTTSVSGVLPVANGGTAGIHKLDATVDPTANEDSGDGYSVGSIWINITDDQLFICVDATSTAAIWAKIPHELSGAIVPEATNSVDLGSSSKKFKDLYLAGTVNTAYLGATTASGTVDMDSNTITGLPTPSSSTDAASKGYVDTALANLLDTPPSTLDTLNELAAALGDDPNFATTMTTALSGKLSLSGGTMTGNIAMGTNKITGLGTPTTANDAVNKTYIDTLYGSTTAAATSATAAATSASAASTSATNAASSASAASTSASNAASSATSASTSATNAGTAQTAAETAETNAAASESAASTSETNAASSASSASTSAANAASSASAASTSASSASTSATAAATSETNAAASETAAAASATAAATSATSASTSATNASTSATNAASSAAAVGKKEFVASGAISTGDVVQLNSDGTVSVIPTGYSVGSFTSVHSSPTAYIDAVYDTTNDKVVIAYRGASNTGYAAVGTVTGTSISFGSPVQFETGVIRYPSVVHDVVNNKIVIAYMDDSTTTDHGYAVVGTVSGTSISFGTPVAFDTRICKYMSAVYDVASGNIAIFYAQETSTRGIYAIVGTVSGTSISFGTSVQISSTEPQIRGISSVYDSTNSKVIVAYSGAGSIGIFSAVGTVSGTSISFGAIENFGILTSEIGEVLITYDSINAKVIVAYTDTERTQFPYAHVGTVSGTSISFGNAVIVSNIKAYTTGMVFDNVSGKVIISLTHVTPIFSSIDSSWIVTFTGEVSGSEIVFKQNSTIYDGPFYAGSLIYDPDSDKIIFAFENFFELGVIVAPRLTEAAFWIGTSDQTVSDGQSVRVNISGSIDTNQASLVIGAEYYVDNDGQLTINNLFGNKNIFGGRTIGKALSATELLITGSGG